MATCKHNHRCRYTDGFHCEDCDTFFSKDSPTYRSGELLSSIWMVLHNVNADHVREKDAQLDDVVAMRDKIGIGQDHGEDYEALIAEAEVLMAKYGVNADSATLTLEAPKSEAQRGAPLGQPMSLEQRTEDACGQLTRYGGVRTETFADLLDVLANLNDDCTNGRVPKLITENVDKAKALLDKIQADYVEHW